ncbi:hypothetical protein MRS60_32085 [Burkholderia pyrrocinia]|uniref:hypothetical protein n=1 Tax=Burkholderia pyrrocinia TaxID=60550 RepID=UPI001FB4036C|nr:hypothetical protein [Burkholderia pyrrocinia]UOB60598.1 hypothetical protein MRS60_32085 [Burkholderia pyrrocinia]
MPPVRFIAGEHDLSAAEFRADDVVKVLDRDVREIRIPRAGRCAGEPTAHRANRSSRTAILLVIVLFSVFFIRRATPALLRRHEVVSARKPACDTQNITSCQLYDNKENSAPPSIHIREAPPARCAGDDNISQTYQSPFIPIFISMLINLLAAITIRSTSCFVTTFYSETMTRPLHSASLCDD